MRRALAKNISEGRSALPEKCQLCRSLSSQGRGGVRYGGKRVGNLGGHSRFIQRRGGHISLTFTDGEGIALINTMMERERVQEAGGLEMIGEGASICSEQLTD